MSRQKRKGKKKIYKCNAKIYFNQKCPRRNMIPYFAKIKQSCVRLLKKKLAALSMLHKAKKAYYACDVIRTRTLFTRRQAVAIAT